MAICTFCGKKFEFEGKLVAQKSGKIDYFCGSKCEKNFNMGRKPRNFKWTVEGQIKNK